MSGLPEIAAQQLILIEGKRVQRKSVSEMKKAIRNENLIDSRNLLNSIKGKIKIVQGDLDRISFSLLRYGFIKSAGIKSAYLIHSGQMMPAQQATNWLAKALDTPTKNFADYVASTQANAVVKTIKFNENI
jgi:hypothetical protein